MLNKSYCCYGEGLENVMKDKEGNLIESKVQKGCYLVRCLGCSMSHYIPIGLYEQAKVEANIPTEEEALAK